MRKGFDFIRCAVTDPSVLLLPQLSDITEIYHLASSASPKFYQSLPFDTIAVNTIGTKHMLELARRNGAKMIFASTSEAYGDPLIHPQNEKYPGNVNTWGPRACYDEAKRLGEVYRYEYFYRCHYHRTIRRCIVQILQKRRRFGLAAGSIARGRSSPTRLHHMEPVWRILCFAGREPVYFNYTRLTM
jgi:dTDP-D-glucose 4,6-dehydratase